MLILQDTGENGVLCLWILTIFYFHVLEWDPKISPATKTEINDLDFLVTSGLEHRADILNLQLLERYKYSAAKCANEDEQNHPSVNAKGHGQTTGFRNFIDTSTLLCLTLVVLFYIVLSDKLIGTIQELCSSTRCDTLTFMAMANAVALRPCQYIRHLPIVNLSRSSWGFWYN